jgi:hypothetical protein
MVYLLESVLEVLYPAANMANRERIASLLRRRPNFREFTLLRGSVNKGEKQGLGYAPCPPRRVLYSVCTIA